MLYDYMAYIRCKYNMNPINIILFLISNKMNLNFVFKLDLTYIAFCFYGYLPDIPKFIEYETNLVYFKAVYIRQKSISNKHQFNGFYCQVKRLLILFYFYIYKTYNVELFLRYIHFNHF